MIVAYGINGPDGHRFRFGVKGDKPGHMVKTNEPVDWPSEVDLKARYPHVDSAEDGQWCWMA
jgi:hypothetical protein